MATYGPEMSGSTSKVACSDRRCNLANVEESRGFTPDTTSADDLQRERTGSLSESEYDRTPTSASGTEESEVGGPATTSSGR